LAHGAGWVKEAESGKGWNEMIGCWGRRTLVGIAGALFLAGPALAAPASASQPRAPAAAVQQWGEPRPAIWLLSDDDTRIYLFGTVHILHPDLRWRSPAFDRIAREAQELVLELSEEEMTGSATQLSSMMGMGKSVPVLQRVSPARREGFSRLLRELQIPDGSLDGLETWAVAVILGVGQMAQDYVGGENSAQQASAETSGVEDALTREFRANGRAISGVETAADQISAFRGMPLNVQQAMLDETVDAYISGEEAGDPDEADWINGNLDGIAAEMETLPPELFEALITRRNRNFANWLATRLDRPGTVLFAIGAGHLAGRVSVQSMLESRGLRVRRIY
jgi:uncharacterized protein YbaP (TraB family)